MPASFEYKMKAFIPFLKGTIKKEEKYFKVLSVLHSFNFEKELLKAPSMKDYIIFNLKNNFLLIFNLENLLTGDVQGQDPSSPNTFPPWHLVAGVSTVNLFRQLVF